MSENAADFVPLLDLRQGAGGSTTPVLVALTAGRGVSPALHAGVAADIDSWAAANEDPYTHTHWLP